MKRFWDKVEKNTQSGCWEWTAYRNNKGYGCLMWKHPNGGYSNRLSHRISWELIHGKIEDGLCVLHKCDNPRCVNPEHLFLGTKKDNTQDMISKGRHRPGSVVGVAHHRAMAKLDWEKVKYVRLLYFAERRTAEEISIFFGVARQTIKDIVMRRSWATSP